MPSFPVTTPGLGRDQNKDPHSVRDEGGPPRYHPISHRHAADGHSWGALSGSARMRFSAHRLGSEFARSVSLRALSHDPHSLCDATRYYSPSLPL